MSKKDDGGHAFPSAYPMVSIDPETLEKRRVDDGMSLRDWFAGQALAGMCACPDVQINKFSIRLIWKAADEMIAARTEEESA